MAALLVYSARCQHSMQLVQYIFQNDQFKRIVQLHDVNQYGVPQQYARYINRVPTMLTKNGKILVGKEIKVWLDSLVQSSIENCQLAGKCGLMISSLDGAEIEDGSLFDLNNYGQSLQPAMTPELLHKINQKVTN